MENLELSNLYADPQIRTAQVRLKLPISPPAWSQKMVDAIDLCSKDFFLEIGCGVGGLLEMALKHTAHVYGIEVQPELAKIASKRLPQCVIFNGNARKQRVDLKFNKIIVSACCKVLPIEFLELLEKNGILIYPKGLFGRPQMIVKVQNGVETSLFMAPRSYTILI
jgi:protein-L-isoaspartate O-methyltransferase